MNDVKDPSHSNTRSPMFQRLLVHFASACTGIALCAFPCSAADHADAFVGQWWLNFEDGYGGWLDVQDTSDGLQVKLLWRVGSPKEMNAELRRGDLVLQQSGDKSATHYVARRDGDQMTVKRETETSVEDTKNTASGGKCPPMPPKPDLSSIEFGVPIRLFNGSDLEGWQLQPSDALNGWNVEDGELVNRTPKTDFGAYGTYGNLRTIRTFGDFQLHIEFNVEAQRNSGVYLRGLYEAQVVDRDSRMQGINGPGAIFGRIKPTHNAGKPGGQWQTYDLTLVDRHVTVVLNGQKVIDNEPVLGCTGGALFGDVTRDGPIYLQGDHTSVRYRNILLRPRVR